jgi:hypothetical protein
LRINSLNNNEPHWFARFISGRPSFLLCKTPIYYYISFIERDVSKSWLCKPPIQILHNICINLIYEDWKKKPTTFSFPVMRTIMLLINTMTMQSMWNSYWRSLWTTNSSIQCMHGSSSIPYNASLGAMDISEKGASIWSAFFVCTSRHYMRVIKRHLNYLGCFLKFTSAIACRVHVFSGSF